MLTMSCLSRGMSRNMGVYCNGLLKLDGVVALDQDISCRHVHTFHPCSFFSLHATSLSVWEIHQHNLYMAHKSFGQPPHDLLF